MRTGFAGPRVPFSLQPGLGDDLLSGGRGNDLLFFVNSPSPVEVNLVARASSGEGQDTVTRIEDVTGSPFDDILVGDGGRNFLVGLQGSDIIRARGGDDSIEAGGGEASFDSRDPPPDTRDVIRGGRGADRLVGAIGFTAIFGGPGGDDMSGGLRGRNIMRGGFGQDRLFGSPDRDRMYGGVGDDTLKGFEGDDFLVGNFGHDEARGSRGYDICEAEEVRWCESVPKEGDALHRFLRLMNVGL